MGSGDRATEPAGGGGSGEAAVGGEVADASGSGSGDGVGHGAEAGTGAAVSLGTGSRPLVRTDSERILQRRAAAAGTHQPTGQFVSALSAGGSGPVGGGRRCGTGTLLSSPGGAQTSRPGPSGGGPQAGREVVPEVARRLDLRATVQGGCAGEPESCCGRNKTPTAGVGSLPPREAGSSKHESWEHEPKRWREGPCVPREIKGTRPWSGRQNPFCQSEMAQLTALPEKCCTKCLTRVGVVRDRMTMLDTRSACRGKSR